MSKDLASAGKFISLVLRHRPDAIGLTLDAAGWAEIDALIRLSQGHRPLTRALIEAVVASNDKQRFAISEDGLRIRARQGHSIEVALGLTPLQPPEELFHGTATRCLASIRREGLDKRTRRHVHLSADAQTAANVGARHGTPVVLRIRAGGMAAAVHPVRRRGTGRQRLNRAPRTFAQRRTKRRSMRAANTQEANRRDVGGMGDACRRRLTSAHRRYTLQRRRRPHSAAAETEPNDTGYRPVTRIRFQARGGARRAT